jgi:L-cystine uptake protein TcyP (sodium:dicarboxylate symporter family)
MMRTLVNVSGSITSGVVGNRILGSSIGADDLIDTDSSVGAAAYRA